MRDYINESNTHVETRRKTMGEYRNEAKLDNHPGKTLRDYRIENNMSVPPVMVGGVQQQKGQVNSSQPVKTMRDYLYGYAYQPSYNFSSYNAYGLNWENHHSPCSREEPTMVINNHPKTSSSFDDKYTQMLEEIWNEYVDEQLNQASSPSYEDVEPEIGGIESIPSNEEDGATQVPPPLDLMNKLLKEIDFDDPNVIINYGESTISFGCFELNDEEISMTVDEL